MGECQTIETWHRYEVPYAVLKISLKSILPSQFFADISIFVKKYFSIYIFSTLLRKKKSETG